MNDNRLLNLLHFRTESFRTFVCSFCEQSGSPLTKLPHGWFKAQAKYWAKLQSRILPLFMISELCSAVCKRLSSSSSDLLDVNQTDKALLQKYTN